jgi:hypothetical protein
MVFGMSEKVWGISSGNTELVSFRLKPMRRIGLIRGNHGTEPDQVVHVGLHGALGEVGVVGGEFQRNTGRWEER